MIMHRKLLAVVGLGLAMGFQTLLGSFFLEILRLKRK